MRGAQRCRKAVEQAFARFIVLQQKTVARRKRGPNWCKASGIELATPRMVPRGRKRSRFSSRPDRGASSQPAEGTSSGSGRGFRRAACVRPRSRGRCAVLDPFCKRGEISACPRSGAVKPGGGPSEAACEYKEVRQLSAPFPKGPRRRRAERRPPRRSCSD